MVRVYQLAKQLNITSKRVLEVAEILGINVKAHQSSLSEEDVSKIIKYLKKNRRIGIVFNKAVLTLIDFIKNALKKRNFATGLLLGLTAFTIFGFSISNANDSVAEVEIIDTVEQIDVLTTTPTELTDQEGSSPLLFTDSDDSTTTTTVPVTTTTTIPVTTTTVPVTTTTTVPVTTTTTTVPVTTTTTTVPVTTTTTTVPVTTTTVPVTCDDESFQPYTLYKATGEANTVMSCRNEQDALGSGYIFYVNPVPPPTPTTTTTIPVSTNYTFDTDWRPHGFSSSSAVIDIDSNNNLYVTGVNNASYAMTIGTQQIDPKDFFVYKLNQLGDLEWIKVFGNSPSGVEAYDIAVDNNGNSILTGAFSGSIDFGTGIQTATGSATTFILKLDSNGETEWVVTPDSSDVTNDFGYGVDTDSNGNIYVSGYVNHKSTNTVTSITIGSFTISNVNWSTNYYLKINSSGVVQWVKTINAVNSGAGGIFVDSQDNKYLSGRCAGDGNGQGDAYSSRAPTPFSNVNGDDIVALNCATPSFLPDVFVIKLDSSDDYVWHWKDWGAAKGGGVQIIANNNGDVFVTYYINAAQPEICGSSTTTEVVDEVYVLVKLDSTGTCQWFYKSEDLLISSNWTNRLGVDSNNNIYMNTVAYTYNPAGYYNYSFSILVINNQGVRQNSLSWNTRTYDFVFDTDDNIYLNRIMGITKSSLADLVIN
jgi:hypothetical protein